MQTEIEKLCLKGELWDKESILEYIHHHYGIRITSKKAKSILAKVLANINQKAMKKAYRSKCPKCSQCNRIVDKPNDKYCRSCWFQIKGEMIKSNYFQEVPQKNKRRKKSEMENIKETKYGYDR